MELALDDFGTEYATFMRLHALRFDIVKIDKGFVAACDTDLGRAFIRAFVDLANGLGAGIIAEGIETTDQLAKVIGRGLPPGAGLPLVARDTGRGRRAPAAHRASCRKRTRSRSGGPACPPRPDHSRPDRLHCHLTSHRDLIRGADLGAAVDRADRDVGRGVLRLVRRRVRGHRRDRAPDRRTPAPPVSLASPTIASSTSSSHAHASCCDDGITRAIEWQENVFYATEGSPDGHELVLLAGVEPHYAWREFASVVVGAALGTEARLVVTLGATPAQTPHTRMPMVQSSSASPVLATNLGLRRPRYEGITGIVGVLQTELDTRSYPAISMQVGVPFYAAGTTNWKAAAALLRNLEHVTGVPTDHQLLAPAIAEWEAMVDEALGDSHEGMAMLPRLEAAYDRETEQQLPSADDLAAELERYLREFPPDSSES